MKPTLAALLLVAFHYGTAQSLDYISVRKKNGRVVKNFYTGSRILLQTADNAFLEGPIQSIRNDTATVRIYDVRLYRTALGSVLRDTITFTDIPLHRNDIKRISLNQKQSFFQRNAGPLLMIGGGGYFALNVLNGALHNGSITGKKNRKVLGISLGAFGLGYLLHKLFSSDGFSKKSHRIEYVDL